MFHHVTEGGPGFTLADWFPVSDQLLELSPPFPDVEVSALAWPACPHSAPVTSCLPYSLCGGMPAKCCKSGSLHWDTSNQWPVRKALLCQVVGTDIKTLASLFSVLLSLFRSHELCSDRQKQTRLLHFLHTAVFLNDSGPLTGLREESSHGILHYEHYFSHGAQDPYCFFPQVGW